MEGRDGFAPAVVDRLVLWRRIAYRMCGDWGQAEELLQQALVQVYLHWPRIDPLTLDAYARKVILRLAIDESRKPHRRAEVSAELAFDRPARERGVGHVDDEIVLQQALARLPPGQRACVVLRHFQGLPIAETAAALGVSEGTVKSQTARGIQALRADVGADFGSADPPPDLAPRAPRNGPRTDGARPAISRNGDRP